MKINKKLFVLCLVCILGGCSSINKPDVSDVEQMIIDAWSLCEELKVVNIRKTNGVDKGESYDMSIAYGLEIVRDIPSKGVVCSNSGVAGEMMSKLFAGYALGNLYAKALAGEKSDDGFKKGDVVDVAVVYNMIKSENGWIVNR